MSELNDENGSMECGFERSASASREYQDELRRLRRELGPALERARRGEGREIDFEEFRRRCRERFCNE